MHNTTHNRYAITYKNTHLNATDRKQLKSTETTPKTKKNNTKSKRINEK